ncbi:MAG: polysaccharide biosynthesis tyrosine autokinase [Archangiaceae bacterium]|nr:polysaccharide biosynthesis tyrosine autokinase [Archangiaceae bacterium]
MATTFSEDPAPAPAPQSEGQIDLRAYWRIVLKRRWLIVGVFLAVVAGTAAYALRLPKIYSASTTMVIEMTAPKVLGTGLVQDVAESSTPVWFSKEFFETQFNVMRSRAVAERVANKVRTARDDAFLRLDSVASEEARVAGLKALEKLRAQIAAAPEPALVLMGKLTVEPVKESRIARLQVDDLDPLLAAGLVNAFARAYMEHNLASKTSTTQEASDSLETQLPDLEAKLQKSAVDLSDFKKKHDIVSTSWEDKQNIVSQRLNRISDELTTVRVHKAAAKARYDAIVAAQKEVTDRDAIRSALVPTALAGTVGQMKIKVIELRSECVDLEDRMLPQHPKLVSCHQRLAAAETALNREIDAALTTVKVEYNDLVQTEKNLLADMNETKAEAMATIDFEPDYLKLKRAHEYNLKLYDLALRSLKESGLSGSTRLNNVSMLDTALAPAVASKPNVKNMMLIGELLGLLLGLGLAFGLEVLDNTITSQEQIEERLGVTFLGIIPSIRDNAGDLVVAEQPKSAVAECCRAIRTNLLFMSPERPLKSLLVTSAGPRDGKTTTAASLAITMAKSGNKVLLVDADLRRPRVHQAFKIPNGAGLSSLILGEGTLEGAVKSSGIENLSVLTCGPIPPNPAELLHTQAFTDLLAQLTTVYDRVIIDSPPVGAVADAIVMSTKVDGTVMVLKSGVTAKDTAKRTVRAMRDVKARLLGAVLNDINLDDRQGSGYYYYAKYGYYYGETEPSSKNGSAA